MLSLININNLYITSVLRPILFKCNRDQIVGIEEYMNNYKSPWMISFEFFDLKENKSVFFKVGLDFKHNYIKKNYGSTYIPKFFFFDKEYYNSLLKILKQLEIKTVKISQIKFKDNSVLKWKGYEYPAFINYPDLDINKYWYQCLSKEEIDSIDFPVNEFYHDYFHKRYAYDDYISRSKSKRSSSFRVGGKERKAYKVNYHKSEINLKD